MAKEKEQAVQTANDENIQDVINNMGTVTEDVLKQATEEIAKQQKEKDVAKLKSIVMKMDFVQKSTLLSQRRQKRVSNRTTKYLKDMTALIDDIKAGKVSIYDFDKKSGELKRDYDKELRDISNDIDESRRKLNDAFPDSWSYRWSGLIPGND